MRLVQVTIPAGKRDAVLGVLDDEGIDYVVSDETSGREFTAVVSFPLPSNAVEPILERLREVGIDKDAYTVVLDANTVVSRRFEELQERYAEEEDEDRIAREELTTAADDLAPTFSTYVVMTIVSALIATAGLLLDSPAVVVGSMVIAPLIGPAMATSVGTVVDDDPLFRRGVKLQAIGLVLAVASAAVFALVVRYIHLIPPLADVTTVGEIRERVAPDFLSLVVALGAGVAGVISLSSGVSTALVGVMIAVALIPPAATIGIGLAWGQPLVSLGSAVLLLVNVLSINLAAMLVLWYKGYRPERWFQLDEARAATIKRVVVLVVAIVALSVFLGGVTLDSYQRAATEERLQTIASEAVADTDARLLEVEVRHTNTAVFQRPSGLVVTVGVSEGESVGGLAARIDERADRATGTDIDTQVRYLTVQNG
ncbi:MAG: TIGR00341 family protein [Haloarculaceae archaeon]